MLNHLNLCYTTLLNNCHCQIHGDNAVSKSTDNLSFSRLKPRITKVQKIKQGTKNEGEWKESRYVQVKQWLIMINRHPEEK